MARFRKGSKSRFDAVETLATHSWDFSKFVMVDESESSGAVAVETIVAPKQEVKQDRKPKRQPKYNVILWDDDDHTYEYVIEMMMVIFGHAPEKGFQIAKEVDLQGRAICLTTTMEHAELKRDQIKAYGKDHRMPKCAGSMTASIEPVRE